MPICQRPLFTVVMPCYQAGSTVAVAIASVLAQSEGNFELIVVDDGSVDDSATLATAAIGIDRRGRVLRGHNLGAAAARNRGAQAGTGRIIAFLDADDRWTVDFLREHANAFSHDPSLGLSFSRVRFYDCQLLIAGRVSAGRGQLSFADALAENPLCSTSNMSVRRHVFEELRGFDETLRHAEDQEFVVRILATTQWKVAGLNAELVHYRMSKNGLSADLTSMERGWYAMLECARSYTAPSSFGPAERRAKALHARYLARRALRTGQSPFRAFVHLWSALRIDCRALLGAELNRTLLVVAGTVAVMLLPQRLIHHIVSR